LARKRDEKGPRNVTSKKSAAQIRHAAEREHGQPVSHEENRRKSDQESAAAYPSVTDTRLRKGHPPGDDWRDEPVDQERDKDIKHGGIEGAVRKQRGGA
jgi:hypothetical protein